MQEKERIIISEILILMGINYVSIHSGGQNQLSNAGSNIVGILIIFIL